MKDDRSTRGRKDSTPSEDGAGEYLTRTEFIEEMARVAAAFPYFDPGEMTWEVYWNDLHFIPRGKLISALSECRLTLKFFPSVSEIVEAAIGKDYHVAEYQTNRPATIRDIIVAYMRKKENWDETRRLAQEVKGQIGTRH